MIQFKQCYRMSSVGVCVALLSAMGAVVACDDGEWPEEPKASGGAAGSDVIEGSPPTTGGGGNGGNSGAGGANAGNGGTDPTSGGAAGANGGESGGGVGGNSPLKDERRSLSDVSYRSGEPGQELCATNDQVGHIAVYPRKIKPDSEETRSVAAVCVPGKDKLEWVVQAVRAPADATWVGFLYQHTTKTDVATSQQIPQTDVVTFRAVEGKDSFTTLSCKRNESTVVQGAAARGDASAPETPVCLDELLDKPPFADLGEFKARLIGGRPSLTFYPKDGGDPLPITLFLL